MNNINADLHGTGAKGTATRGAGYDRDTIKPAG